MIVISAIVASSLLCSCWLIRLKVLTADFTALSTAWFAKLISRYVYSTTTIMRTVGTSPRVVGSSHSPRVLSDQNTLKITVFNPFSGKGKGKGKVIEPPPISDDLLCSPCTKDWEVGDYVYLVAFHKFILLSTSQDDDFVAVAVIFEKNHMIAFWSLGQDRWVKSVEPDYEEEDIYFDHNNCYDVCLHRGKFYAITTDTVVIAFTPVTNRDNNKIINWCPRMVVNFARQGLLSAEESLYMDHSYIVGEWEQDLILVVCRSVTLCNDGNYFTAWIRVFEVNVETGDAREVTSLGNRTIFVGFNSTFFVVAPTSGDERACKPNCIYFTDDNNDIYLGQKTRSGGGSDVGIYSLVERKVLEEQVYDGPCASRYCFVTPPMWVEDSQNFPFTLDSTKWCNPAERLLEMYHGKWEQNVRSCV